MTDDIVIQQAREAAHHPDDHRGANLLTSRLKQRRTQAAAREPDTAKCPCIHIGAGGEVARRHSVLIADNSREAYSKKRGVLGDQLLVKAGRSVIELRGICFGGHFLATPLVKSRHLLQRKLAATPEKDIRNEHGKPTTRELVGIGARPVVLCPRRCHALRDGLRAVGDLLFSIELEAPVVMECNNAGQCLALAARGAQIKCLGARAVAHRPGEALARNAALLPALLGSHLLWGFSAWRER